MSKRGNPHTLMNEVSFYPIFSLIHVKYHCRHIFLALLIHQCLFLTATNGQQKSIAGMKNRNVPLITDDFLFFAMKMRVLKAV